MEELLDKISSYDIVNCIVPGAVVCIAFDVFGFADVLNYNALVLLLAFYATGLIASRLGSIIVEPIAKKTGLISYAPYEDYVSAEHGDGKIRILQTISNMYRSLIGAAIIVLSMGLASLLPAEWRPALAVIAAVLCFILIVVSWRKQNSYLQKSIVKSCEEDFNVEN